MYRIIVMLGSDFSSPGGISAVLCNYRDGGLFARWPVKFLPTYRGSSAADKLLAASTALLRFVGWLLTGRVAVIHAHTAARASFWRKSAFLLLGSLAGCRTILHLHDGSFPAYYHRCGSLRRWAIRAMLGRVDRVVVLTAGWLATIRDIQPAARFMVIANPVTALAVPPDPQAGVVLFLGRLWREKGILDLIEASAMLAQEFPELRVVCAGDGDIPSLRRRVAELRLERHLFFPGWMDGPAKNELLARASIFVLPSYAEGLPIGVLEAMINGIPVVASKVGGIPDALGSEAGLLVPPGDPAALSAALARLLRDPELRRHMGSAGRRRAAEMFAGENVLARIGELYLQLGIRPSPAIAVAQTDCGRQVGH